MITCVAMILGVTLQELPSLALNVESEARALTAQTRVTPEFMAQIETFSGDAERLSVALREAQVAQDLPCIFHGISQDARERMTELQNAHTDTERSMAFNDLHALLSDAILIAPMAASAAADRAAAQNTSAPSETASNEH